LEKDSSQSAVESQQQLFWQGNQTVRQRPTAEAYFVFKKSAFAKNTEPLASGKYLGPSMGPSGSCENVSSPTALAKVAGEAKNCRRLVTGSQWENCPLSSCMNWKPPQ